MGAAWKKKKKEKSQKAKQTFWCLVLVEYFSKVWSTHFPQGKRLAERPAHIISEC